MRKYDFKTPYLLKGVAVEKAVEELERIREKYGELQAETIVDESRSEDAVLHPCFEWDDSVAAELWRKKQAQCIISNITVIISNEQVTSHIRAYVHVRPDENSPRSYMPLQEVVENKAAYKDLLEQSKADMQSFVDKYRQIEELNQVKAEMLKYLSHSDLH